MYKKTVKMLLSGAASLLIFVASIGVSPNSMWILYEPDIPKSLKK